MAKVKLVLLLVMSAVIVTVTIMTVNNLDSSLGVAIGGIFILLGVLSLLAFLVISIISIFRSSKLIKQQDEEKLKKSARLVKTGSVFLWVSAFIYYIIIYKITGSWNINKDIISISLYISLYAALLGTSVFSIAYIRLLYKEKKISPVKTVIYTLLQLIFVFDIISILIITRSGTNKKSAREIARFFLGSYKPPEFFGVIADSFRRGPVPVFFNKADAFLAGQRRNHRVRSRVILAVLCLIPAGLAAWNFYRSRLPQPISVSFSVQAPGTTGDPENRPGLQSLSFLNMAGVSGLKEKGHYGLSIVLGARI